VTFTTPKMQVREKLHVSGPIWTGAWTIGMAAYGTTGENTTGNGERGTGKSDRASGSLIAAALDTLNDREGSRRDGWTPVAESGLPGCLFPVPRSPLY
jgi:hypothetical protein